MHRSLMMTLALGRHFKLFLGIDFLTNQTCHIQIHAMDKSPIYSL